MNYFKLFSWYRKSKMSLRHVKELVKQHNLRGLSHLNLKGGGKPMKRINSHNNYAKNQ